MRKQKKRYSFLIFFHTFKEGVFILQSSKWHLKSLKMNTKKIIFSFYFLFGISLVFAQQVNFEWAKQMRGTGYDEAYSVALDPLGNVYTTGNFQGTVDFDPGAGTFFMTAGSVDIFISKLDVQGNFVWAKKLGGSVLNYGYSIALDPAGNIYLTGTFSGVVDFDPGAGVFNLTSSNFGDLFVCKLDVSGNFIWVSQIKANLTAEAYSLAVDATGKTFVTGSFRDTVDFDPGVQSYNLVSNEGTDIFVLKLDASGNFLWAKQMGGTVQDMGRSIAVDIAGNVLTCGHFMGTADLDPGAGIYNFTSTGYEDIFILKLDALGSFVWAKQIGGIYSDYGEGIVIDNAFNIYCTGQFTNTVDFDPGAGIYNLIGISDVFILKLNVSGNFIWGKQLTDNGSGDDRPTSIALDTSGEIYTTGRFNSFVLDCDPGPSHYYLTNTDVLGNYNTFISKLDTSGNFVWAQKLGGGVEGGGNCWANSIAVDVKGNVYTTGFFMDTIDFDPGASVYDFYSVGNNDIFVHKLSQCFLDTSVQQNLATLIANASGITYQWIDCNNGNAAIAGATGQSYSPLANGSYALIVNNGSCSDTSSCHIINTFGINSLPALNELRLFPNPSGGETTIKLNKDIQNANLRLVDIMGQTIYETKGLSGNLFSLDISGYSKGIYFLELREEQENVLRVMLVKK